MSTFIGGFLIAFCKGWLLFLVLCACIPALVIAGGSMSLLMTKIWSQGQVAYAEAGHVVEQTIGAIRMVASFIGENKAAEKYDSKLQIAYAPMHPLFSKGWLHALITWTESPCINAFAAGQAAAYKMFEAIEQKSNIDTYDGRGIALEDVSVQTAAVVGQSESGKSTVISFLEGFFDPDAGEVLTDIFTLKMLKLKWIRGKMGLASQELILFATTLKESILFGNEMILMKRLEQQ
ncbi:ABC transporter B family member 9-like [Olea europaea subsp. europaea]|uniref:ABC transporter B family member 9-like n=1 Tax=Olea europaea subsp. europaea TaxID=158383 RepID=A0A8S0UFF3_OLEEU|nr:ABC transporter B family member 9-like [Olea europaea subsp. europaea]